MTGTRVPAPSAWRSRRATSKPSRSGSMTSSTIRSGRRRSTALSAARPLATRSTSKPLYPRARATSSVMCSSSSTASTYGLGRVGSLTVTTLGPVPAGHGLHRVSGRFWAYANIRPADRKENLMAWDFETDADYQEELDWVGEFVRDEVEPLEFLIKHGYDLDD